MTYSANAVKAMFNAIAKDTFYRARDWFKEHLDEPYCYWAKDEFIAIKDKGNKELLSKHPEIEDIDDHTIVEFDSASSILYLGKFCPKLKQCIKELVDTGYTSNKVDGVYWSIAPKDDNYRIVIYEED